MNAYIGKICPFCKTPFEPEDEVVLCSNCDMPHHKDCWIENQGCTTFGCVGTIKNATLGGDPATATPLQLDLGDSAAPRFCTACGQQNQPDYSFCVRCGRPIGAAPAYGVQPASPQYQTPNTYRAPVQAGNPYQSPNTYRPPVQAGNPYQSPNTYRPPVQAGNPYQSPNTYRPPVQAGYQQPANTGYYAGRYAGGAGVSQQPGVQQPGVQQPYGGYQAQQYPQRDENTQWPAGVDRDGHTTK